MGEEDAAGAVAPAPIRRLEEAVVNRIAAGEVIQRPASALKELLENSLDAGATSIGITVKDGGVKLIQIVDNGHGIRYEDLPLLCERHTTSKLREFEDLETISTLGFRGEALASITFVAHLSVTTMTEGQAHGYKATYKDGQMEGDARPCAAVKGTQITVENLFYNVAARRKAFKNLSEEYGRILDVVSRYAVHKTGVSFSCKKHGDSRADVHTVGSSSRTDTIRAVYGPGVARELIAISASEDDPSGTTFKMDGLISSANYSSKRSIMVLFINGMCLFPESDFLARKYMPVNHLYMMLVLLFFSAVCYVAKGTLVLNRAHSRSVDSFDKCVFSDRLVECGALRKAIELVYATILPKASKPFIYMSINLPPEHVDVNVHPTKREVSFLNQESLVDIIQQAVEAKLLESNNTRTFSTQTLLPGASIVGTPRQEGSPSPSPPVIVSQKAPVNKLVRVDSTNPAGRIHAFLHKKRSAVDEPLQIENDLATTRRTVRQRRNPKESADLTSVQELLAAVDRQTHSGLTEIIKQCIYVGMADDVLALTQCKTRLYVLNVVNLSKELVYQQVLRRFAHFNVMRLSTPAPLMELLMLALDEEERMGRWSECDGPKDQIAQLNVELLMCKAEMLKEYFAIEIDELGNLCTLPVVLDQYTPDMDRLPSFVLNLGNNVDWETEMECFETFAAAMADFYAMHPPFLPNPNGDEHSQTYYVGKPKQASNNGSSEEQAGGSDGMEEFERDMRAEAEAAWAHREWTIQHVLFPAMKLFLKPPSHMANDGTAVQVACLENLYKIFERC
ncbi:hypothetical protein M758_2G218500 [Ceratodon purpureus]|nr:hypothetical protein M758_2G218500 [Ceratodon purpureus]